MVSNSTLAALCISSGLQEHLMFESYHLANSIQVYVDQLKAKQDEEHEQATRDSRAPGQYWLEIDPPKVCWSSLTQPIPNWTPQQALSDVVESIVGAIYISDNFSLVGAEALFNNVLKPFYDRYITLKTLSHHPTKILFELFQAQGCQQFQITKEKNQDFVCCDGKMCVNLSIVRRLRHTFQVIVHDVILASATDSTGTVAARWASLFALDALEGDAEFLIRTCDCRTHARRNKSLSVVGDGFGDDSEEIQTVESVLTGGELRSSGMGDK
jgi:endoribonuclease Dicer